jgi:hypothetical protein
VSQTRIKRRLPAFEVIDFDEGSFTDRGEKVYKTCRIVFKPLLGPPYKKVFQCDPGIGITEEWIEETIQGSLAALHKDYPWEIFEVVRHKPNDIVIEYSGTKGIVQ